MCHKTGSLGQGFLFSAAALVTVCIFAWSGQCHAEPVVKEQLQTDISEQIISMRLAESKNYHAMLINSVIVLYITYYI